MYQDIHPYTFNNEYHHRQPQNGDIIFGYHGNEILSKDDTSFYSFEEISSSHVFQYLFSIDDIHFFMTDMKDLPTHAFTVNDMRTFHPKHLAFAAVTGWHLYNWYRDNRFCGRCGRRMIHDDIERAMRCEECGNLVYPKIMPAVIVGILDDHDHILVSKYAYGNYPHYALIAGYAEIGESIEETVRREVKEETNLDVEEISYFKSQPWAFSGSLLLGFWCHAHGDQQIKLQENELKEAKWISREDTDVDRNDGVSMTSEMIHLFMEGKQNGV